MYCPQCGTESSTGQQYCRVCGANLKVIGKAVTLSEAIARSDRGPLPKIKEMMKNVHIEQVSEEITRALDQMNKEIARSRPPKEEKDEQQPSRPSQKLPWWAEMKMRETPEQRREHQLTKGTISFFSGIGLMIFLYFFSAALVLKLPPDFLGRIPFDLEPIIHMIWLVGLIPALTGLGRITAGLLIKPAPAAPQSIDTPAQTPQQQTLPSHASTPQPIPSSITEHTTELLDHSIPLRRTNEIKER